MAYETILYEVSDGVATVTLNRPARLNAYTAAMAGELLEAMRRADREREVRVIILTGAGRAFCSGADISEFASDAGAAGRREALIGGTQATLAYPGVMRELSKPSIAAINGLALGVGLTMTLWCDVRIASEHAALGAIFARIGVVPELGSTYILPRLIGAARAAEMMLTARQFTAAECLEMGLVSCVTPPRELMDKARDIASEMAKCSPVALALSRRLLHQGLTSTLEGALEAEAAAFGRCLESPEFREYVAAFLAKGKDK